jgi:hypothetical protein
MRYTSTDTGMATTVKIAEQARNALRLLADAEGITMTQKLERMIRAETKRRFLGAVNEAYGELRRADAAWQAEMDERSALEGSLGDDLD